MSKLFHTEKIQEFVANRLDFEFRDKIVKPATDSEPEPTKVEYKDIDQSTTIGKIQASSLAWYGEAVYKSWFIKPALLSLSKTSKEIVIECKSGFIAEYIKQHYYKAIEACCNAEDSRWWNVDGAKLIISMKEEVISAKNESIESITLESAIKLKEKCDDDVLDSSIVFIKQGNEFTVEDEVLEEVKAFKAQNTEIVRMPHSLLSFVRNVNYEQPQGEYLNDKLCTNEQKLSEEEILASITEKLSEKYTKQDEVSDEKRAHMYSIRLMKSFN